ncbi:restriction endonuclease subunit S [Lactococcus petauri]|uniref:restriction endonuclease subunit S n=1 Tax=Lactococcus petauri TaxID=1940789 RepID=UPI003853A52A
MTPEQLKASILQRAMEGKLVPQDPHDEPASELLKRIKSEKEKLIKEGKIKRDKNETEIFRGDDGLHYEKFADGTVKEIEVPFDIPDSWQWCRIDQLALAKGGKRVPKGMKLQEEENDYPYLRVTDMKNETILDTKIQYAPPQVREVIKNYTISSDDLYITIAGTIGNAGTIPTQFDGALLTENALKLIIYPLVNKMFLLRAINSPAIQNQFLELFNQVAQPKLSIRSTNSTLIPLPPSTEQKRILERLEGVFEVLPKYEISYAELAKLNKEFPEKLRKSILQYAMQGKLVPQDPNDEPVEVLLEKIRQEKQKLFEEGKLKKKDLQESTIYKGDDNSYYEKVDDGTVKEIEVPFNVPTSWKWVRFSAVSSIVRGGSPRPIKEFITEANDGINWIKIGDTDKGGKFINSTKEKIKPSGLNKTRFVTQGTFLLTNSMSFGRPYILNVDGAIHDGWLAISNYEKVFSRDFLYLVLSSNLAYSQFLGLISGAVVKNLNSDKVASLLVPVPPLMEQTRIVNQVEELNYQISQLHE